MMAVILNSTILVSAKYFTHFLSNSLTAMKSRLDSALFAQKKLHSFILTQLDDGSHLEFCHLGFRHLVNFSQIHSKTLSLHSDSDSKLIQSDFKLIHSHSTWWWQPSWILLLHSAILVFLLSNSLTLAKISSHYLHKKDFTHSFWLNLMMAAILNSAMLDSDTAILDSDTLLSSLRFTQKHSHSTLTLTQTNSIWLKVIHSHLTKWWQPSWILPFWIWPSLIHPS